MGPGEEHEGEGPHSGDLLRETEASDDDAYVAVAGYAVVAEDGAGFLP